MILNGLFAEKKIKTDKESKGSEKSEPKRKIKNWRWISTIYTFIKNVCFEIYNVAV